MGTDCKLRDNHSFVSGGESKRSQLPLRRIHVLSQQLPGCIKGQSLNSLHIPRPVLASSIGLLYSSDHGPVCSLLGGGNRWKVQLTIAQMGLADVQRLAAGINQQKGFHCWVGLF